MKSWRQLDKGTRRELLRGKTAHPDPQVAAVAVGYARTMLGFSGKLRRALLTLLWLPFLLIVMVVAAVIVTVVTSADEGAAVIIVAVVLWLLAMGCSFFTLLRRQFRLMRMENLNSRHLGSAARPAISEGTPAGERLDVRYDFRALLRSWTLTGAILIGAPALAVVTGEPFIYVPMIVVMSVMAVVVIVPALRVLPRRDKPVLTLDSGGVSLPQSDFTLPWHQIATVRVLPMPHGAGRRGRHRVVTFVPDDVEQVIQSAPPKLAKSMRRATAFYGSPLVVIDKGLTSSADEITRAAESFGCLKVHQVEV
jgi:hypothetical protein